MTCEQGFGPTCPRVCSASLGLKKPHTCCRSTVEYSFQLDKILSGFGQMRIMGHPANLDRSLFSNADFMELAGEGFSIPIAAMLIHAYWENPHAPWW